jgi:hypothetical protein
MYFQTFQHILTKLGMIVRALSREISDMYRPPKFFNPSPKRFQHNPREPFYLTLCFPCVLYGLENTNDSPNLYVYALNFDVPVFRFLIFFKNEW